MNTTSDSIFWHTILRPFTWCDPFCSECCPRMNGEKLTYIYIYGLKFSNGQMQASFYVVTGANTTKNWTYHVTGHEKKCARKWCQKFSTFYDITFAFGKMWL